MNHHSRFWKKCADGLENEIRMLGGWLQDNVIWKCSKTALQLGGRKKPIWKPSPPWGWQCRPIIKELPNSRCCFYLGSPRLSFIAGGSGPRSKSGVRTWPQLGHGTINATRHPLKINNRKDPQFQKGNPWKGFVALLCIGKWHGWQWHWHWWKLSRNKWKWAV